MDGPPEPGTCVLLGPSSSALAALPGAVRARSVDEVKALLDRDHDVQTVVLGPDLELDVVADFLSGGRGSRSRPGVVLERRHIRPDVRLALLEAGLSDVVSVGDLSGLAAAVARSQAARPPGRRAASAPGAPPVRAATEPSEASGGQDRQTPPPRPAVVRPPLVRPAVPRPGRRGRVTTLFSAKGGTGKTTLATNLAAALADGGRRRVVVVDLDVPRGDVAIALDLFPASTLADAVALGAGLTAEELEGLLTPHSPGLSALLAPETHQGPDTVPADVVGRVLDLLVQHVDHVVVDTSPSLDAQVLTALDRSDTVLLLSTLDIAALRHLKLTLDTLQLLGLPPERWRVVLNRADSKVGLAVGEVERTLGLPLSGEVPSSRAVPTSVNLGVPLVLQQPGHPVSVAVVDVAERVLLRDLVVDLREAHGEPAHGDLDEEEDREVRGQHRRPRGRFVGRRDTAGRPAPH